MPRSLFLSHSGIDTEAASALKARVLAAPAAREQGLAVWFDKNDLRPGVPWQSQIEEAIARSQAFAVYVGSGGVVNWVEAEVRLALNRAITEPDYRFVPILADETIGPESLPGFARQFQGVFDVEAKPDQFERLMQAVLGGGEAGGQALEAEPFVGLRAMDESRSYLFFGREAESEALTALLHSTPLVLVSGDSGSGKSSLVRAGLVPRFRGGALALLDGARPEDSIWQVVTARPRGEPLGQLGEAVEEAARKLGRSLKEQGDLADWAASSEIDKVRRGLRCGLPAERTRVLLVVDQFEELLTITPPERRKPFIDLLLGLADPADGRCRVVLTMRHDYVNLCNAFDPLRACLDADHRRARFMLGRMSDEGLHNIVAEPLRLAGIAGGDREALAGEVLRDVGERPGDLALVQMALTETWHARHQHSDDLLRAYADVGRVEGALAQAAEHVRTRLPDDEQRVLFDSILLRLVRLGDTGGATRRIAGRGEFNDARWSLVQELASNEGKRLVLVGGGTEHPTVEIAHEALVTAWPYFQNLLQAAADDKRAFDALIPRAQAWGVEKDPGARTKRLATGADLELFAALRGRRPTWLSDDEDWFINASVRGRRARRRRKKWQFRAACGIAILAGIFYFEAKYQKRIAEEQTQAALANESRALTAISEVAGSHHRYADALKLAVAAWPRSPSGGRPKLRATIRALGTVQRLQMQTIPPLHHEDGVLGAQFNGDESRILTWSLDGTARLWDAATGTQIGQPLHHEARVWGALFNGGERSILTWSEDRTARLWDAASGAQIGQPMYHEDDVLGARFNNDKNRILTWSLDGTARLWDVATGTQIGQPLRHEASVWGALFSGGERRVLTWSSDGTARLWDVDTGVQIGQPLRHEASVWGALFNGDETRILTWSSDGSARLWDAATDSQVGLPLHHEGFVWGALFNRDESHILTWSSDYTARLWDATTGVQIGPPLRHEDNVLGALFNGDESRVLTWSSDGTARLWDAATFEQVGQPLRHEGTVEGALFDGDESRVLTWSSDGTARLWDAATGQQVGQPLRHEGSVWGALFNGDESRILTWSFDGTTVLWDAATGAPAGPPFRHEGGVLGALFDGDESRVLTWSSDGTARLWDAATGQQIGQPLRHEGSVWGALFNGDESRILTWSLDGTARLWDVATDGPASPPLRHQDGVLGALFNGDESRILTWSLDGTARMWGTATGEQIGQPLRHKGAVSGALYSDSEDHILTWSFDGTARLWDVSRSPRGHLIEVACGMLRHHPIHDTSEFERRYGITITEPICRPGTPAPVWAELED